MPVCLGVGLVFGSGAVAHYKSIIKLRFYLLFFPSFFPPAPKLPVIRDQHGLKCHSAKCTLGDVDIFSISVSVFASSRNLLADTPPSHLLAPYRCFQVAFVARCVIREISQFGLNPKQADLQPPPSPLHAPSLVPPYLSTKTNIAPPAVWRGWSSEPPPVGSSCASLRWQR